MKAISLWQPWATLVALGVKRYETRSWATRYRGPLAIHATKTFPKEARYLCREEPFLSVLIKHGYSDLDADLPRGCIVAIVDLINVRPTEFFHDAPTRALIEGELDFGDFSAGRFAWSLRGVKSRFTPIPARGAQGLWLWDDTQIPLAGLFTGRSDK